MWGAKLWSGRLSEPQPIRMQVLAGEQRPRSRPPGLRSGRNTPVAFWRSAEGLLRSSCMASPVLQMVVLLLGRPLLLLHLCSPGFFSTLLTLC